MVEGPAVRGSGVDGGTSAIRAVLDCAGLCMRWCAVVCCGLCCAVLCCAVVTVALGSLL